MLPRGGPGSIYQANGSTPAHAGPSTRQTYSSSATSHCKHHHSYQRTGLKINMDNKILKVGREKTHVGNIRKVETFQDIAYCTFLNSCHTNFREAKDFFTL